jgi:DNA-binding beta-propeller fold protein YncE
VLGVLIVAGTFFTMSSSPASAAQAGTTKWQQASLLQPPSGQLGLGDIGWFDARHSLYLYADGQDNQLLVVRGKSVKEVSGLQSPTGVVSDPSTDLAWVANSDSTLKVIDLKTLQITQTISTGGQGKVDEVAYDSKDHILIAANPDETPPFLTLVSTSPTRHVLAKIPLPTAQKIEQPAWDPTTDLFTVNVPQATGAPGGEVVVVSPRKAAIVNTFTLTSCAPSGAVFGKGENLLIACDSSALVLDAKTGAVRATISGGGGADEVAYDAKTRQYFAARLDGGLLVIDATANKVIQTIPSPVLSHSVAVDAASGEVFLPELHVGIVVLRPQR